MKPHPRIRKTIKWGGAAVTVLLVVVWIASGWFEGQCSSRAGPYVYAGRGMLSLGFARPSEAVSGRHFWPQSDPWWSLDTIPAGERNTSGWSVIVQIWHLALVASLGSAAMWRLDTLARRRAKLNLCPKCGYDRTGILQDAKCPECGAAQASG